MRGILTIAVITLLPLSLTASLFASREANQNIHTAFRQRLADLAHTAASQIDTQLMVYQAAATVLAQSPELMPGGMPGALYYQAWQVGKRFNGWVVLSSAAPGHPQVLNTLWSEPQLFQSVPTETAKISDEPLLTKKVAVSNLIFGRYSQQLCLAVSAPSLDHDEARYVVNLVFSADEISRKLAAMPLPDGAIAVVIDGAGSIIGRSRDAEKYVGTQASGWAKRIGGSRTGVVEQIGLNKQTNLFVIHQIDAAPAWHVAVAMPSNTAETLVTAPMKWVHITWASLVTLLVLGFVLIWINWRNSKSSYEWLDQILAQAPAVIGVYLVRPDGSSERVFLSRSALMVFGWPYSEVEEAGNLRSYMDAESLAALPQHLCDALSGTKSTFEFQVRSDNGSQRRVRCSTSVMQRFPDGSGTVATCFLDVSDIYLVEQRLRLMQKLAILGEVSSGIAHELNQPLAALRLAAENGERALQRDPPNLESARQKFTRIGEQSMRIGAIIEHVRALSRNDPGKMTGVDIGLVLHEVLSLLEHRLHLTSVTVQIDVPEGLPSVRAVGVLLEQVVLNVIGNALDAYRDAPTATPRVIRVEARSDGKRICIRISDQAGGIPEAIIQQIFEPFFTTKVSGKGTGLGLSISLASISEMGGEMHAHNEAGGACFEITLPIYVDTTASPAIHNASQ